MGDLNDPPPDLITIAKKMEAVSNIFHGDPINVMAKVLGLYVGRMIVDCTREQQETAMHILIDAAADIAINRVGVPDKQDVDRMRAALDRVANKKPI